MPRLLFVLTLAVLSIVPAPGQTPPSTSIKQGPEIDESRTFGAAEFHPASNVRSKPYSADVILQTIQEGADGAQTVRWGSTGKTFRDSRGRTRTELPAKYSPLGSHSTDVPRIVTIVDPVAQTKLVLDPLNKIAHRQDLTLLPKWASPVAGPLPPPEVKHQFETLKSRKIEGLSATGHRFTTIYPPGYWGNDQPVAGVSEDWYSKDLRGILLMRHDHPRFGVTNWKMTNISRAEPDPKLFQVPPGYKVVDERGKFTINPGQQ